MTTGIVHDLPIDEYHASPAISHSGLCDFARSPLHYYARHIDPERPPEEPRAGQLEGTLAHCAILEPDQFDRRYAVGPCDDRRLKAWKSWAETLAPHITALRPSEAAAARAQAASVRALPEVAQLLAAGNAEVSADWRDAQTGVHCRCRPDWVHPLGGCRVILLDVKTYSSASPVEFAQQVARNAYHRQAAWYTDGYAQAAGVEVMGFVFVAVETAWPYAACAAMLDDDGIERGRVENRALLARFAECQRAGEWPGYSNSIELIPLPRWYMAQHTTQEETIA